MHLQVEAHLERLRSLPPPLLRDGGAPEATAGDPELMDVEQRIAAKLLDLEVQLASRSPVR